MRTSACRSVCRAGALELVPTLGEMIDSGHRLVVVAGEAGGPAPWYRNFYAYAMEAPFAFRTHGDAKAAVDTLNSERG